MDFGLIAFPTLKLPVYWFSRQCSCIIVGEEHVRCPEETLLAFSRQSPGGRTCAIPQQTVSPLMEDTDQCLANGLLDFL